MCVAPESPPHTPRPTSESSDQESVSSFDADEADYVASVLREGVFDPELHPCKVPRGVLFDAACKAMRELRADMGRRRAEQKMAHLFCEVHSRLRAVDEMYDSLLPLTQDELADILGEELALPEDDRRRLVGARVKSADTFAPCALASARLKSRKRRPPPLNARPTASPKQIDSKWGRMGSPGVGLEPDHRMIIPRFERGSAYLALTQLGAVHSLEQLAQ